MAEVLPTDFLTEVLVADLVADALAGVFVTDLVADFFADSVFVTECFPTLTLVGVTDRLWATGLFETDLFVADLGTDTLATGLLDLSREADLVADFLVDPIFDVLLFLVDY